MSPAGTRTVIGAGLVVGAFALGWAFGAEEAPAGDPRIDAITAEMAQLREALEGWRAEESTPARPTAPPRPGPELHSGRTPLQPEPAPADVTGAARIELLESILGRLESVERKLDIGGLGEPGLALARNLSPHPKFGAVEEFIHRFRDFDDHGYPPQEYRLKSKRQIVEEFGTPNGDANAQYWSYRSTELDADGDPVYTLWFTFGEDGLLTFFGIELSEASGF